MSEQSSRRQADVFMDQFDEDGRFTAGDGAVDVVFGRRGSNDRFPGKLHFSGGRCVRAEMPGGGDWALPDNRPLVEVHFLLLFDGERPHGILINDGRVVQQYDLGVIKG